MTSKICLDAYLLKELGELSNSATANSILELDNIIKSLAPEAWETICFCITPWKGYEEENEEFVKGIGRYIKKISRILKNKRLLCSKSRGMCARVKNRAAYIRKFLMSQYVLVKHKKRKKIVKECKVVKDDDYCNECVQVLLNKVPDNVLEEHPWTLSCIVAALCRCMECDHVILGEHNYQHFIQYLANKSKKVCRKVNVRRTCGTKIVACINE